MEELKCMVKKLENEHDESKQIKILQEIEERLLNEYVIKIGDTIIEPLRLEAYYYPFNDEDKFHDPCAHKSTKKINNFGSLYLIEERYGYPGIDICLSLEDYYLSFLIKNSRIENQLYKQIDLYERFQNRRSEIETMHDILVRVDNNKKTVMHTSRVGLNEAKTKFAHELLASVVEIFIPDFYDWEKGFGKEWTVANYFAEINKDPTDEEIKNILGYRSQEVKVLYNELRGIQ